VQTVFRRRRRRRPSLPACLPACAVPTRQNAECRMQNARGGSPVQLEHLWAAGRARVQESASRSRLRQGNLTPSATRTAHAAVT
jgi:hypothetical protein